MGKFKDTTTTKFQDTSATEWFDGTTTAECAENISLSASPVPLSQLSAICLTPFSLNYATSFGRTITAEALEALSLSNPSTKNALFAPLLNSNINIPSTIQSNAIKQASLVTGLSFNAIVTLGKLFSGNLAETLNVLAQNDAEVTAYVTGILQEYVNLQSTGVVTASMQASLQTPFTISDVINLRSILTSLLNEAISLQDALISGGYQNDSLDESLSLSTTLVNLRTISGTSIDSISIQNVSSNIALMQVTLSDIVSITDVFLTGQTVAALCEDVFNIQTITLHYEAYGKVTITFTFGKSHVS